MHSDCEILYCEQIFAFCKTRSLKLSNSMLHNTVTLNSVIEKILDLSKNNLILISYTSDTSPIFLFHDVRHYYMHTGISGGSRISRWGGRRPVGGGGADLRHVHFLAKTYAKMKEIDPVGGRMLAAPPGSANGD